MFCAKCGTKMEEGSKTCSSCGWIFESEESQPNIEVSTENVVNAEGEGNSQVEEKVTSLENYMKEHIKEVKILAIIIFLIIITIIVAISVHYNSDTYKIKQASELIAAGEYAKGTSIINDIYSPQAVVIKKFVEVENESRGFIGAVEYGSAQDEIDAYYSFQAALNEFENENEIYYLPDNLRKDYDCYRAAFDYISEYAEDTSEESNEMISALYDVQGVMMNEVDRNNSSENGPFFKLETLQARVDCSKQALEILKNYSFSSIDVDVDAKVFTHCKVPDEGSIYISSMLHETVQDMIEQCELEISLSQKQIDSAKEKFDMDDELYKVAVTEGYTSYVGLDLKSISSYADIFENRETILERLKRDMLYFLITGSTAN